MLYMMYNRRFAECNAVVDHFKAKKGEDAVRLLRDVSLAELEAAWDELRAAMDTGWALDAAPVDRDTLHER
ncbi:MAG: hypothetical protein J0H57_23310 [Rhodospirillales bacterium]|nr:hypothetical protein [Rhodospirillales bacterium]